MADTLIAGGREAPANDTQEWGGELTALEARAEIGSLHDLQFQRRALVEQNARLIARYGPFGLHDDYRKSFVEAQKIRARMDLAVGREKKPTEGEIDAAAYGSDEYAKFLDNALEEKVEYLRVQTRIDELNEQIRSREEELRCYRAELGLQ